MYAIIRHSRSTSSPRSLHEHSTSPRACATFVLNDMLSSSQLKPFCCSHLVFTPMDPEHRSRFSRWLHWSWSRPGAWVSLRFGSGSHRRLRQESVVGVAIMISDTRGHQHADMIRSVAKRPRGADLRHRRPWPRIDQGWCLASTNFVRNEALWLPPVCERRRLQAGALSMD